MIMPAQYHFTLHHNPAGRLVFIDEEGTEHVGVEPVRSFPISEPNRWISLVDRHGHELASISDLADVSSEIAQLIAQQLADREFLPRIERIVSVEWHKEPHRLNAITDRGSVEFLFRDDDIRRLGPTRAIIVDVHGVRFYIPDSRQLDAKSRRILSQYL